MAGSPEEVAYNEALRSITQQQGVLDGLRSRAGTLFASASIATSFLGGLALQDTAVHGLGWVAVGAFVGMALCSILILWPRWGWVFRLSADDLVRDWVDERGTMDAMHRDLALYLERHYQANESKLGRLLILFQVAAVLLVVEVVAWLFVLGGGAS